MKTISLMAFLAIFTLGLSTTVLSEDGPGDFDPIAEEAPGDGWAPSTRWVIHPITGFIVQLELILELPDKAFYEQKVKPGPPLVSACTADPDLCILIRPEA